MRPHSRRARRRYHTERVIRKRQARYLNTYQPWGEYHHLERFKPLPVYEVWQRQWYACNGNLARATEERDGRFILPDYALARRYAYHCGCRMCSRGWDTPKGVETVKRRQQDKVRCAEGMADYEDDKLAA